MKDSHATQLLLIDDDVDLCALLSDYLTQEQFTVSALHDGAQALEHCRNHRYDAIVLDIMLPGMQGLDVLRQLRSFSETPVLMLTARGDDTDRIVGLELGADDYLPKPCNPRELVARLRAILRRTTLSGDADKPDHAVQVGTLTIEPGTRNATLGNLPLALTSAEFSVLLELMRHAGRVVDKADLSRAALGRELVAYDRSIDVHVSNIRKKLSVAAQQSKDDLDQSTAAGILNIRGKGYQFALPPASEPASASPADH